VSLYHYPHDLKLTWIYDLPMGPEGRWATSGVAGKVLGGWQLAAIMRYRSGAPLRVTTSGYTFDAIFNPGMRPDVLSYEKQTVEVGELDSVNGSQYLIPAAFSTPDKTAKNVPARLGDAPRWLPTTRQFALLQEDLSLIKRTDLGFREGATFEIRFDFINLFNRNRLDAPITTNVTSPSFGKIRFKTGIPRNIQAGLRINW